jgi:hypothetical protein
LESQSVAIAVAGANKHPPFLAKPGPKADLCFIRVCSPAAGKSEIWLLDERYGFYVIVKMLKDKRILDRIIRIDRMNFLALRKIAKKGPITLYA